MKKLLCLMGGAMLVVQCFSQSNGLDYRELKQPYYIDSWFNMDTPLGEVINYTDSIITLKDFDDKLIILDFWFTGCTVCIRQFPKEINLQKKYRNKIQFVLVTNDSKKVVTNFLNKWRSKNGSKLPFPIVVSDTLLKKAFRHLYDPHYGWLFPDGKIIGQTSEHFVTKKNILELLKLWKKKKKHYEKRRQELLKNPIIQN